MSNLTTIQNIINSGIPNAELILKSQKKYDVNAQKQKEQQFYKLIVNPFNEAPIKNIKELNELILELDSSSDYNFGALLPFGKVEQILSQKYDLKKVSKSQFTETEQQRIKDNLNELAEEVLKVLPNDLKTIIGDNFEKKFITNLLLGMGALNAKRATKDEIVVMFAKTGLVKPSNINEKVYDSFNFENFPKQIRIVDLVSNLVGTGSTKKRQGTEIKTRKIKGQERVIKVTINPDLNEFSPKAFEIVYNYAKDMGWLDKKEDSEPDEIGTGTLSPMDVSPEQWRRDVFDAISQVLGGKYKNIFLQDKDGQYGELFNKYKLAEEIALGRSKEVLRGFMGELRGILIVDAMIPSKAQGYLMGTAKVQLAESLGKESAPIDLIVDVLDEVGKKYGFQIKNTSELSSYSWGNQREKVGMAISKFYLERLQSILSQEETNFFGAYVYNQPIDNASNEYINLYNKFETQFNENFIPIYKKLALYIIRQETEIFESYNPLLSKTLINDFFIMNNKIIPASSFYQSMNTEDSLIESTFSLQKPNSGYYQGEDVNSINYNDYIDQAKIKYQIKVKYTQLLQSAYNIS